MKQSLEESHHLPKDESKLRKGMLLTRCSNGKSSQGPSLRVDAGSKLKSQESRQNNLKNERAKQSGFQNDKTTATKLSKSSPWETAQIIPFFRKMFRST